MQISLTKELEKAVKDKVDSGMYSSASEVISEALRNSLRIEAEEKWMRREVAIGYVQLISGETTTIKTKKQFLALAREP